MTVFSSGAWMRIKDLTFPSPPAPPPPKEKTPGNFMIVISQKNQTPATVDIVLKVHNK